MHRRGGRSLAAAVRADAGRARSTGDIERSILALRASRQRVPGGLMRRLLAHRRGDGSFDGLVNWTAFGVMALRAAGRSTRDGTVRGGVRFILRQQNRDRRLELPGPRRAQRDRRHRGGAAGPRRGRAVAQFGAGAARRRIRRRPAAPRRGLPAAAGRASNAQSTAWAVQAFVAAGRNPDRVRRGGSRTPLAFLRSLQAADGSVRYSRTSGQTPVWVTAQALTAFARRPFPLR